MTERQSSQVIEVLRSRLGVQYHAGIDEGRREIARVLADELRLGGDEADAMVRQMMDAGQIRYVTGDERDPVTNDEGRVETQGVDGSVVGDSPARRGDPLLGAAVGQGGPQAASSGQMGGPVLPPGANLGAGGPVAASGASPGGPVAAAGSGGGAPGTLAVSTAGADMGDGRAGAGYWEFLGDRAGVVPSTTRKGQVEPRGT